jgi:HEAT repeat protein
MIPFLIFALVTLSLFVWQASRVRASRASANSYAHQPRNNRSRPNQAGTVNMGKPASQPAAPANAMSDADAERILALPAQQQAEELLERAIGHDPRALQLFEDNVEEWVGHISLTDHMRQLENRSQYSTDLRVRYANADIYLALDGWHKNEDAATMLIERAKTDLHYRSAAVYFLGMLAGRGVAYDEIHPVLLNYAKNDPDATVRQWAVEGMRYLGKDEALDELWESFTQDPAMAVRNRAGCNLSDCGTFTRRQRMRMVPRFLELLGDSNLDPQMRSWSFLALQEITDANLPNDLQAWQNWYGQRGAAKLAQFERQNWWQVRGDQ